ncbi:GH3 auxin-responsive promoter-domain-containing protein [Lanmaoa asiatica]|nr:GH3 auxin-responsive promoter-domain-containing protein [Lanmaoa asiatica]
MTVDTVSKGVSTIQTPQKVAILSERMNDALLKIIRGNFNTQYATQTASLAGFRDAVSVHDAIEVDATLLADFRSHVPLSNYDSYKPFVDKFNAHPCKEEDVVNLFSPGFPDFLAYSGGTTAKAPKILPKYNHDPKESKEHPFFEASSGKLLASVLSVAPKDVKEIERAPGEVVRRILVTQVSGGYLRRSLGWYTGDEDRLTLSVPGYASPWAASLVKHLSSFLIVHGLFFLASRDVGGFYLVFATMFVDLIRHIDEQWDVLVSCIRDGTLPDLEGADHVRKYLQASPRHSSMQIPSAQQNYLKSGLRSPSKDGPPAFGQDWSLFRRYAVASSLLWFQRSILGPKVFLHGLGYNASEAGIALPHCYKLDEFVLGTEETVEFLDVSQDETHENLRQARCTQWEVEVGKQYEPILTTRDGLWRYRLGDILYIVGFDDETNSPVFKVSGRRVSQIMLRHTHVTEDQLLETIRVFSLEDVIEVQEFTTMVDNRAIVPTVGFFFELTGPLGPNTDQARQKIFDALATTNVEHQPAIGLGLFCIPNDPHRGEGHIKVPLVLVDPAVQDWILDKVVQEL